MKKLNAYLLFVLTSILLSFTLLQAQALDGTLRGEVTDPSGAVVAGAMVTATNIATNVARTTTTSGSGSFNFPNLLAGTYTVTVEKPGFKSSVQKNVVVPAARQSTANTTLMVGDVSDTVEVTAPEIPAPH